MKVACTKVKGKTVDEEALSLALGFGREVQILYPDSYVYLFGSHAKGNPRPGSDIDAAVIIDHVEGFDEDPRRGLDAFTELYGIGTCDYDPAEAHLIQADSDVSGILDSILATGILLFSPEPATP